MSELSKEWEKMVIAIMPLGVSVDYVRLCLADHSIETGISEKDIMSDDIEKSLSVIRYGTENDLPFTYAVG